MFCLIVNTCKQFFIIFVGITCRPIPQCIVHGVIIDLGIPITTGYKISIGGMSGETNIVIIFNGGLSIFTTFFGCDQNDTKSTTRTIDSSG
ncbi:hypothetical protein D3C85_1533850 [compost metagenome]